MVKQEDQTRGLFYGLWIVAGCFVLLFVYAGAGFYSFSIFIKPLEEQFGWNRAAISFTMSIYMILAGLVGPFVGQLIESYGPKKIMTYFALVTGVCFILVSFTASLWYFYVSYALLAIGTTGIGFIPVSSVLARWFTRRRGTAIGFAMVGMAAGGLVIAPLAGHITYQFGWQVTFVFLGLLVWVLALPVTLFVIKNSPAEMGLMPDGDELQTTEGPDSGATAANASPTAGMEGWPLRAALRTRAFFWLVLTFFLASLAQMGMLQHQVPLIVEAGISEAVAVTALGLTAGLGGLGKLSFGWITEILPIHYAAILCFGMQALGVFVLLNAHDMTLIWVYVVIFGFAMGGVIVLLPLAVVHFFGLAAFGVIIGMVSLINALGCASGTLISGLIYDYLGSYYYGMIAYIGIYLAAIITILLVGRPEPYTKSERGIGY